MPRLKPFSSCNLPQNGIAVRLSDCRSTQGLAPCKFCRRVKPLVKISSLFNRCSRQPGQIAGRHISDAFIRPAIAVAEMAVGHPQPFCLVIHKRYECLLRPCNSLRQHHASIIARKRHDAVEEVFNTHFLPRREKHGGSCGRAVPRSAEHTSELQSLMRISYAVFCLKKKNRNKTTLHTK